VRVHLLVNPVAGRNRAGPLADAVARRLEEAGAKVTVERTRAAGDAGRMAAALAPDAADRVVVVGGDGTLREVVNARPLPLPWPLGLLPVGTANVVGRELRIPLGGSPRAAATALLAAQPWAVNALEVTYASGGRELAVANVGVGLDAEVVRAVSAARARRRGLGGYAVWLKPILATVAAYRAPRLTVRVDQGRVYPASALVVQGGLAYGGVFRLAPDARLDAPTLSVALLQTPGRRDAFRILARALARRATRDRDLLLLRAHEVAVAADPPVGLQADGDPAGETPLTVRLLPRALTLLRAP
jgi:diacylglycerol kinase (ATP)